MKKTLSILLLTLLVVGCGESEQAKDPESPKPKLSPSEFDAFMMNAWISNDLHLYNRTGRRLHEVRVTVKVTGANTDVDYRKHYWAVWTNDYLKVAETIRVGDIQSVELWGECDEGSISVKWAPVEQRSLSIF